MRKAPALVFFLALARASASDPERNRPVHEAVGELCAQLRPALGGRKPRLALIELEDVGEAPKARALGRIFSDLLAARLAADGAAELVERARLNQALEEHKRGMAGLIDPASAQQVGKVLAADFILAGSVSELGPGFDVSVRLIDVEKGRVAGAATAELDKAAVEGAAGPDPRAVLKQLDALEAALVAYGAHHVVDYEVRWPARLAELVPAYLDRIPYTPDGRWVYDAKEGRVSHSAFPALKPSRPRMNAQTLLDDAAKAVLKAQMQELRVLLANFCVQAGSGPPALEDVSEMPPPIPLRYQARAGKLPPAARKWGYDAATGEFWNEAQPEVRARIDCGPPLIRGPSPSTRLPAELPRVALAAVEDAFFGTGAAESLEFVELPSRRAEPARLGPSVAPAAAAALVPAAGAIWALSPDGARAFDKASGEWRAPEAPARARGGLVDPDGALWLYGPGLHRWRPGAAGLERFEPGGRYRGAAIAKAAATAKALWLATDKGLLAVERASGRVFKPELPLPAWSTAIADCAASGDFLWCANADGRFLLLSAEAFPRVLIQQSPRGPYGSPPSAMLARPEGLWVVLSSAAKGGLAFVRPTMESSMKCARLEGDDLAPRALGSWGDYLAVGGPKGLFLLEVGRLAGLPLNRTWKRETVEFRPGRPVETGLALRGAAVASGEGWAWVSSGGRAGYVSDPLAREARAALAGAELWLPPRPQ